MPTPQDLDALRQTRDAAQAATEAADAEVRAAEFALAEVQRQLDASKRARAAAQDAAATADLEHGNAVNAAAREAEAEQLTREAIRLKAQHALTINLT